jgi:hypothetical protein
MPRQIAYPALEPAIRNPIARPRRVRSTLSLISASAGVYVPPWQRPVSACSQKADQKPSAKRTNAHGLTQAAMPVVMYARFAP